MTTKRPDELAIMTPEEIRAWREQEAVNVFGAGYRKDKNGKPIETGIGSSGNKSENHYQALAKYEGQAVADAARKRDAERAGR